MRNENKLSFAKTFWVSLIAGVTTGMGNGSVFGAAMMCALGRGKFDMWGGWGAQQYLPSSFNGFVNWSMILFGVAFMIICMLAMSRHGELEANASGAGAHRH